MAKNILVIVAHPDDEVLACGGTIANHLINGERVVVAILGEGKGSRLNDKNTNKLKKEVLDLRRECELANKILGVHEVIYHNYPDNAFDSIPLLNVIQHIEKLKKKYLPDIVYTHHHADINIDHQITFKAVITAFRPIKNDYVPYIYSCEVPSATEWQAPNVGFGFQPNVFLDITETLSQKKHALAAYKSELRNYPHPRSIEAIEIIARRWGSVVGFEAAEPFVLVRGIIKRLSDAPQFILRLATLDDESDILTWRNDKVAREISEYQDVISVTKHAAWFRKKLLDPGCKMFIGIGDLQRKMGLVRFDMQGNECVARVSAAMAG